MWCLAALFAFATAAAMGCQNKRDESKSAAADAAKPPAADAEAAASAGGRAHDRDEVVAIAPDMLRDLRITTLRINARSGTEAASLLGEVRVDERRYAEVGSPIAARVVRLLATAGDRVTAGQPLMRLQSIELGKARAAWQSASAHLALANQALARKRTLESRGIASVREVQEAEAEAAASDAELRAAEAALTALGIRASAAAGETDDGEGEPSQWLLRSPVRGVVIDRTVATGQMLDPNKPAFRIADLSRLWLVVHAFERDAVRITEGAAARITLPDVPGRTFSGRVAFVGREVDSSSRTIPVRIELENPDGLLRPGMSASASVPIGQGESTTLVPTAAVQRVGDRWCVFVPLPGDASRFAIRPIGRGRDFGADVEVLSGLSPGDTIIVDGAFLLRAEADKRSARD